MLAMSPEQRATISVSAASFSGREREYVLDCLNRGWITQGYYVQRFEESFAGLCGVKHAVACSSGTAALHLALLALGIGRGDSVIVPALTYVATANVVRYCGAEVVFADVDPQSWCLDPESARRARDRAEGFGFSVKGVLPVHLYDAVVLTGQLPPMVEDAAHVIRRSVGRLAAYSFYASKIVACGEGGMVTTDDDDLAEAVRLYRGQGATTPGAYHHSVIGYNYRMTDLQAAVGLAQLECLPQNLKRRRAVIDRYRANLVSEPRITLQGGERASGWMMAVLVPENADRDLIARALHADGIETRPFFEPLPALPMYTSQCGVPPVAESVARRGLCLPTHTELADYEIDYVCERLIAALDESERDVL